MKNENTRDFSTLLNDASAFRQQVRLAAVQVAGLKPDELAQALAYELEPFSGIPAAEAEVLFSPVADPDPAIRVYDVAVKHRRRRGASVGKLERWLFPAIVFAALVIAGLIADGAVLLVRRASLEKALAARRPLQAQLDRLHAETRDAQAKATAVRTAREAAIRAQTDAARHRSRHADILAALADACRDAAVVTAITGGEKASVLHVSAVATSADAATRVLQQLTDALRKTGGAVRAGRIVRRPDGTTVTFEFDIKDEL